MSYKARSKNIWYSYIIFTEKRTYNLVFHLYEVYCKSLNVFLIQIAIFKYIFLVLNYIKILNFTNNSKLITI